MSLGLLCATWLLLERSTGFYKTIEDDRKQQVAGLLYPQGSSHSMGSSCPSAPAQKHYLYLCTHPWYTTIIFTLNREHIIHNGWQEKIPEEKATATVHWGCTSSKRLCATDSRRFVSCEFVHMLSDTFMKTFEKYRSRGAYYYGSRSRNRSIHSWSSYSSRTRGSY